MLTFELPEEDEARRQQVLADAMKEHLLFGMVLFSTNPADGGPTRVLSQLDYEITVKPKETACPD